MFSRRATPGEREAGGAFDPRVEVLSRLWARCAQLGRLPTARGDDRREGPPGNARLAIGLRRAHGRAAVGLPAQS